MPHTSLLLARKKLTVIIMISINPFFLHVDTFPYWRIGKPVLLSDREVHVLVKLKVELFPPVLAAHLRAQFV